MGVSPEQPNNRAAAQKAFLEALEGSTVAKACKAAGIGRTQVYEWRKDERYADFRDRWDAIVEKDTDDLERAWLDLCINGEEEATGLEDADGNEIVRMKRYPQMAQFMLASRRRAVYGRHQTVELEGDGGALGVLVVPAVDADAEWLKDAVEARRNGSANGADRVV